MSSKHFNLFVALLIAAVVAAAASPMPYDAYESYAPLAEEYQQFAAEYDDVPVEHLRVARSPRGGSVGVGVNHDRFGTVGSAQYNQNLWSANNGNSRLDAYAQASKNFDHHGRPNYGGGLSFSHHF